jgi:hypothetical protein
VLGSEAAKLRSELDAVRKQKRAYKEQREMAEMIKKQQGAFAQRMSLEGLPKSLRDELMAAMSRAATDLEGQLKFSPPCVIRFHLFPHISIFPFTHSREYT